MEISLKEGEEIKIKAKNGTSYAYTIIVCYKNYILNKKDADFLKEDEKKLK